MPRSFSSRRVSAKPARRAPVRRTKAAVVAEAPAKASHEVAAPPLREVLFQEGLVHPHHKQALILAHAHARKARREPHPHHRWVFAMGVGACCLVLAFGWWFTVGSWIKTQVQLVNTRSMQDAVQQQARDVGGEFIADRPSLSETSP